MSQDIPGAYHRIKINNLKCNETKELTTDVGNGRHVHVKKMLIRKSYTPKFFKTVNMPLSCNILNIFFGHVQFLTFLVIKKFWSNSN